MQILHRDQPAGLGHLGRQFVQQISTQTGNPIVQPGELALFKRRSFFKRWRSGLWFSYRLPSESVASLNRPSLGTSIQ